MGLLTSPDGGGRGKEGQKTLENGRGAQVGGGEKKEGEEDEIHLWVGGRGGGRGARGELLTV